MLDFKPLPIKTSYSNLSDKVGNDFKVAVNKVSHDKKPR